METIRVVGTTRILGIIIREVGVGAKEVVMAEVAMVEEDGVTRTLEIITNRVMVVALQEIKHMGITEPHLIT